jgi:hypothetical protein
MLPNFRARRCSLSIPLVLLSATAFSGGNDSAAFRALSLCPSTLAVGKSCLITLTFLASGIAGTSDRLRDYQR